MDHPNGMYAAAALVALSRSYVTIKITLEILPAAKPASDMTVNVNKPRIAVRMLAREAG